MVYSLPEKMVGRGAEDPWTGVNGVHICRKKILGGINNDF